MNERVCRLAEEMGCKLMYNEPLKKYTTFKVGGECSCIIKPKGAMDCGALAAELKKEGEPFLYWERARTLSLTTTAIRGLYCLSARIWLK